tara:strand:+ start:506 stop:802 length:297 start_codon:yes stop_codon:yes gene_type:complete
MVYSKYVLVKTCILDYQPSPEFLSVKSGDYIAIKEEEGIRSSLSKKTESYWFGQVISCIGGARDPKAWTLFQVMNIDSGEITIINADRVEMILKTSNL